MVKNMFYKMQHYKKYQLFIFIVVIFGLISGLLYYNFLPSELKETVDLTVRSMSNFQYNAIVKDLIVFSLLLITSFFLIGIPISIIYLYYECLSIGFLISIFFINFKLGGLLFILIYIIINKLITTFLLIIFIKKIYNISKLVLNLLIYKERYSIDKIIINFKYCIYIIIFIFILNILLYFLTPLVFDKIIGLIK